MPVYEYECAPCLTVYEVRHGMSEAPLERCPSCRGPLTRLMSAPSLNRGNFASPTAAKYSKMSAREEIAREKELQKDYQRIWLPPPVKHEPWD
jgi:putative FmdB family regulatory protein